MFAIVSSIGQSLKVPFKTPCTLRGIGGGRTCQLSCFRYSGGGGDDRTTPSRDSCAGERRTPACARPRGAHGDTVRSSDRSSYGTAITFRPAGAASFRTPDVAATVEINIDILKSLNSTNVLKLKFPKE